MNAIPLAILLLGHLLADFPLQPNWVFRLKSRSAVGVALHVAIHVGVTMALIRDPLRYWPALLVLGLTHFVTDVLKLRYAARAQTRSFLLDQVVHLAVLWLLSLWMSDLTTLLPAWMLYGAVVYAAAIAAMVFLWVYANEMGRSRPDVSGRIRWASARLLWLSQVAALPLLIGLVIELLLLNLTV